MFSPRGNGHYVPGPRPWSSLTALSVGCFVPSLILGLTGSRGWVGACRVVVVIALAVVWWNDLVSEATLGGQHTSLIVHLLKFGFILFILSEIMLFFSFFWSWLHARLAPTLTLGCSWPPVGITAVDPYRLPLLNTILLLRSGVTVTWAHYLVVRGYYALEAISITVILGTVFLGRQLIEYKLCSFCISDSVFGSVFYMTTGLHGLHVMVGALFLLVGSARIYLGHFSSLHHVGLELAIWYWHFVDVVWLGLYILYYVWVV